MFLYIESHFVVQAGPEPTALPLPFKRCYLQAWLSDFNNLHLSPRISEPYFPGVNTNCVFGTVPRLVFAKFKLYVAMLTS